MSTARCTSCRFSSNLAKRLGREGSNFQWRRERNCEARQPKFDVSEARRNIPLQTQSRTGQDGILEVPGDRCQRISLCHSSNCLQLLCGFGIVDLVYERNSLANWKIGPVDTLGSVVVVWVEKIVEDSLLVLRIMSVWVRGMIVTSLRAVRHADHCLVGGIMVLVMVK
jgi:hypothetical protein